MTIDAIQVGHWYKGRTGKPRFVDTIEPCGDGSYVHYHRSNSPMPCKCWCGTFDEWAVEDLGTEEPK